MAVSKDAQHFSVTAVTCFDTIMQLLPTLTIKVSPFNAAKPNIESQNRTTGEIRVKVQAESSASAYYRIKILCEASQSDNCNVRVEAATTGLTDLGLGLMNVRQLLAVLRLTLEARLGNTPSFFRAITPPKPRSNQAKYERCVDRAFGFAKRGMVEDALADFEAAILLMADGDEAFFHRGMLFLVLGRLEDAEKDFGQAVKLAPDHLLARLYLQDTATKLAQRRANEIGMTTVIPKTSGTDTNPSSANAITNNPSKRKNATEIMSEEDKDSTVRSAVKPPDPNRHYLHGKLIMGGTYEIVKTLTIVGRHEECDLFLKDGRVSRHHVEIHHHKAFCTIKDNNSTNGTFLNDKKLNVGEIYTLNSTDKISLGGLEITYTAAYEQDAPFNPSDIPTERKSL